MKRWEGQRMISIVSACMTEDGSPTFVFSQITVTQEEAENGIHYYVVEGQLLMDGYEEPFVHFDEDESPPFLHPAVRHLLGITPFIHHPSEDLACPA